MQRKNRVVTPKRQALPPPVNTLPKTTVTPDYVANASMTPRRLTKDLEAGGTFPVPNTERETPQRKKSNAGNESPVNRVTPMRWQWEKKHPVNNTAMRPPTPEMKRLPMMTATPRCGVCASANRVPPDSLSSAFLEL